MLRDSNPFPGSREIDPHKPNGEYPLSNSKLVTIAPSCEARLPGSIMGSPYWVPPVRDGTL